MATKRVTVTVKAGNQPAGLVFSPNGKTLYVAEAGPTLKVSKTITTGYDTMGIAVAPNGKTVCTADSGAYPAPLGSISVINAATGAVTKTLKTPACPPR